MIVRAFDPSSTATGWADVSEQAGRVDVARSGVFRPSKARAAADPFVQLATFVGVELADLAVEPPDVVIVEIPDRHQRMGHAPKEGGVAKQRPAGALMVYAQAVGAVTAAVVVCRFPVVRVPVSAWKGSDNKAATLYRIRSTAGAADVTDDNEADAIGLALWWDSAWPPLPARPLDQMRLASRPVCHTQAPKSPREP